MLDGKVPSGALKDKWDKHRFDLKRVNPANKRELNVIVVGSGLAGRDPASTIALLGYNVLFLCY